jgi:LemA protein
MKRRIVRQPVRPGLERRFGGGLGEEAMFLIFLVVVAVIGLWLVSAYNGLVSLRQRYGQAYSDIDVQLKQRHDLVPNLVETVKGYAAHEKTVLEEVTKARNLAVSAQGPAAQSAAEAALGGALSRLIAVAEAYPDLKANANFQQLQNELSDLENKIAASRRFFNNAAAEYNAACQGFPGVLIAQRFDFKPVEFFNLEEGERKAVQEAPKVQF